MRGYVRRRWWPHPSSGLRPPSPLLRGREKARVVALVCIPPAFIPHWDNLGLRNGPGGALVAPASQPHGSRISQPALAGKLMARSGWVELSTWKSATQQARKPALRACCAPTSELGLIPTLGEDWSNERRVSARVSPHPGPLPEERENRRPRSFNSPGVVASRLNDWLPLQEGEGWGEGEGIHQHPGRVLLDFNHTRYNGPHGRRLEVAGTGYLNIACFASPPLRT